MPPLDPPAACDSSHSCREHLSVRLDDAEETIRHRLQACFNLLPDLTYPSPPVLLSSPCSHFSCQSSDQAKFCQARSVMSYEYSCFNTRISSAQHQISILADIYTVILRQAPCKAWFISAGKHQILVHLHVASNLQTIICTPSAYPLSIGVADEQALNARGLQDQLCLALCCVSAQLRSVNHSFSSLI